MRHLFSPDKTRATIKQTNLYKSAIRHKLAIGAVTAISGLAAIAMTTLPALTNVGAVDGNVDNNTSNQQTIPYGGKIGFIGDSLTAGINYDGDKKVQLLLLAMKLQHWGLAIVPIMSSLLAGQILQTGSHPTVMVG